MDVKTSIRRYLTTTVSTDIGDEDDIFDLGIVDSQFGLDLVMFVEREFSITAEGDDLDIKNFCSIAALTDFVMRKQGLKR